MPESDECIAAYRKIINTLNRLAESDKIGPETFEQVYVLVDELFGDYVPNTIKNMLANDAFPCLSSMGSYNNTPIPAERKYYPRNILLSYALGLIHERLHSFESTMDAEQRERLRESDTLQGRFRAMLNLKY